jgi:hypothetical protein
MVALLTHLGISVWGSRVLPVKGGTPGEWRSNPVNLLTGQVPGYRPRAWAFSRSPAGSPASPGSGGGVSGGLPRLTSTWPTKKS